MKKNLYIFIMFGILISFVFYSIYFVGAFDDNFKKEYQLKMLKSHLTNNNLQIIDKNVLGLSGEWASDKDLNTWYNFIKENFYYSKDKYNCKYWSLVWALYFEKHNIDYKLIDTSKHIFVIADYKDKYCVADENILKCFQYI